MPRAEDSLSRRERQIMDVIYAMGQASVAQMHGALPDQPSYSTVRALMGILEQKGHLKHRSAGGKYIYMPVRPRTQAARSALRRLLDTFFEGSAAQAVAALLESAETRLEDEELDRISQLIEKARKQGR